MLDMAERITSSGRGHIIGSHEMQSFKCDPKILGHPQGHPQDIIQMPDQVTFVIIFSIIWASTQQILFSAFSTEPDSNRSPQLQRLARQLKFHLWQA